LWFLLDIRPASIPSEDGNNDTTPSAPGGRPENHAQAEPLEGGDDADENSGPTWTTLGQTACDKSSSEEDLTAMKPDTIQKKLMSEVEHFYRY